MNLLCYYISYEKCTAKSTILFVLQTIINIDDIWNVSRMSRKKGFQNSESHNTIEMTYLYTHNSDIESDTSIAVIPESTIPASTTSLMLVRSTN